ncbi:MAG: hypothetical protein FD147_996 [Chloroflexi bacterium]|nr:MAG: hypothetical protein FD147_996 [Chloroflexota bacterium]
MYFVLEKLSIFILSIAILSACAHPVSRTLVEREPVVTIITPLVATKTQGGATAPLPSPFPTETETPPLVTVVGNALYLYEVSQSKSQAILSLTDGQILQPIG